MKKNLNHLFSFSFSFHPQQKIFLAVGVDIADVVVVNVVVVVDVVVDVGIAGVVVVNVVVVDIASDEIVEGVDIDFVGVDEIVVEAMQGIVKEVVVVEVVVVVGEIAAIFLAEDIVVVVFVVSEMDSLIDIEIVVGFAKRGVGFVKNDFVELAGELLVVVGFVFLFVVFHWLFEFGFVVVGLVFVEVEVDGFVLVVVGFVFVFVVLVVGSVWFALGLVETFVVEILSELELSREEQFLEFEGIDKGIGKGIGEEDKNGKEEEGIEIETDQNVGKGKGKGIEPARNIEKLDHHMRESMVGEAVVMIVVIVDS
mmetsp:Transcript_34980/g.47791  ORF Transcript_34980/g.47791 Transcript_34980/m.47791 type:complete len:311 (+) Transcript_34980:123-1055(+)